MELVVKNITKKFSKKKVLNAVNVGVNSGEIVAIVGRNGSGKTTLLKIISGIYNLDSGEILIDNKNIISLKKYLIYVPDKFDYFKSTKLKNVMKYYKLAYENFDEKYFEKELEKNKINLSKRISELSKGELGIFSVILGLSCKTKFILLDEPLDGIDIINKKQIIDYVLEAQEEGVGILISSHQLDILENISNSVVYLGRVEGELQEVDKENYSKYQLVYKEKIPEELLKNSDIKVISNIGRVYVVVMRGSVSETKKYLQSDQLLQYDEMPVLLEDIFILNNKEGE